MPVDVKLSVPIDGHKGKVDTVTLREPTYADYMALGEPRTYAMTPTGGVVLVVIDEAVHGYIERCVVSPDAIVLKGVSIADARKLREAILSFFPDAATATEA